MNYEELFTFENLYQSYLKARKSKRHKKDVINFEINLSYNLISLKKELDDKKYRISRYNTFKIHEPKERRVDSISFKDRIVQHCLVDYYLMPLLERILIYDNGACRKKKGTDFCRNRLKSFLVDYSHKHNVDNGYILKLDIHHYFESIYHTYLIKELEKYINDKDILNLCIGIINSFSISKDRGLPLGNQTSQCFGLLYLNRFDRIIKEVFQVKYYVRYMDDSVIISSDKSLLLKLFCYLKSYISSIGLSFNIRKSYIYPLKNNAISFLGFNYYINLNKRIRIKVINQKFRRFKKYIISKNNKEEIIKNYIKYLLKREKLK